MGNPKIRRAELGLLKAANKKQEKSFKQEKKRSFDRLFHFCAAERQKEASGCSVLALRT